MSTLNQLSSRLVFRSFVCFCNGSFVWYYLGGGLVAKPPLADSIRFTPLVHDNGSYVSAEPVPGSLAWASTAGPAPVQVLAGLLHDTVHLLKGAIFTNGRAKIWHSLHRHRDRLQFSSGLRHWVCNHRHIGFQTNFHPVLGPAEAEILNCS